MVSTTSPLERCARSSRQRRRSPLAALVTAMVVGAVQGAVLLFVVLALRDPAPPPVAETASAAPAEQEPAGAWMGRIKVASRSTRHLARDSELTPAARLLPGWVARVYAGDRSVRERLEGGDRGTFVVDETTFHLGLHRYHGIGAVSEASYRLNAFYDAQTPGWHQLGIDLDFAGRTDGNAPRCLVSLELNGEPLLSRLVSFRNPGTERSSLAGEIELAAGLHRADLQLRCDYVRDRQRLVEDEGALISVSVLTRQPGERRFLSQSRRFLYAVDFGESALSIRPAEVAPVPAARRLAVGVPMLDAGGALVARGHAIATVATASGTYR